MDLKSNATTSDMQRITRRINELSDKFDSILEEINNNYDTRLADLQDNIPKKKPFSETLENLAQIDKIFAEMEERQNKYEKERFERLKKLEEESIENGQKMIELFKQSEKNHS